MYIRARHRFLVAASVVFCLLFQQVAVAAYSCKLEAGPAPTMPMSSHCAQMDMPAPATPPLCAKHCSPDITVLSDTAAQNVPALALPPLLFAPVQDDPSAFAAFRADVPISRSDPPPRLRYCSLLI